MRFAALGQRQPGRVLLEGREAVRAVVVAWQALQLRPHPHVMLAIRLVHRVEQPRHPADPRLDRGEAQSLEALQHARGAQIRHRLDGRRQRVGHVVDHRAAVAARRARVAPGGDVERDRQIGFLDQRPHRIEVRQIVVDVIDVVRRPRSACTAATARGSRSWRRARSRPSRRAGRRWRSRRTGSMLSGCGPNCSHAQSFHTRHCALANTGSGVAHIARPLLGKMISTSTPSVAVVADAVCHVGTGARAHPVLAFEAHDAHAVGAIALAVAPLHALVVGDDARHALAVLRRRCASPTDRAARWRGCRWRR